MAKKTTSVSNFEGSELVYRLFGKDFVDEKIKRWGKRVDKQAGNLFADMIWKGLYTRTVLEPKVRQLCAISGLTVLDSPRHLKVQIRAAFNSGSTREEVKEAIIQMATYAGMCRVNNAFTAYEEVVQELDRGNPAKPG